MSTTRLFLRITGIFVLLIMLFGAEARAQVTIPTPSTDVGYTWKGGTTGFESDWNTAANWTPSPGYPATVPGSSDVVLIDNASHTISIPSGVTISELQVDISQTITLEQSTQLNQNGSLTTGLLFIGDNVSLKVNQSELTVNDFIVFGAASVLDMDTRSTQLNLNGKMYMSDRECYVGTGVYTLIGDANFVQSDVVFMGTLDINYLDIPLGVHNLYMGPNPGGQITGYNADVGDKDASGSIVTKNLNYVDANNVVGRVCKGYGPVTTTLDSYFTFPLRTDVYEGVTHLVLGVLTSCSNASNVFDGSEIPFPNIAARVVFNSTGQGGHPGADASTPTVWHHWPIIGNGIDPGVGLAGYVAFHNNYRNGGVQLFTAMYKDLTQINNVGEFGLEVQDPITDDPLFAGYWDKTGSQLTPTTGGNSRVVPFGPYVGPAYGGSGTYNYPGPCMIGFGDIGVGTNSGGLIPVELTSFSARYYDGSVRLAWQTVTELNNHGFYVERSLDGENWEDINFIEGAGTSNVPLEYNFTDVLDGMLQEVPQIAYRLRQEDRDGTIDYSGIVYAYTGVQPDRVELYKAYPNPFNPSTTLSFSLQDAAHVTLRVYNTFGQEVATVSNTDFDAGFHTVEFQGAQLPSGVYIAVLEAAGSVQQQKLVLNK